MGLYSDEKPRLSYFVPNEFIVLTEHRDDLKVEDIAKAVWESNLIQANIKKEDNDGRVLIKPVINIQNVSTLRFNENVLKKKSLPKEEQQELFKNLDSGRQSFSLVSVNVEATEDHIIVITNTLHDQLLNSGPDYQPNPETQLSILQITPNWLLSSAPAQEGGGGPGKRPVPPANPLEESEPGETVQAAKAAQGGALTKSEFHNYDLAVAEHPSSGQDREVDVIILDTAPSCAAYEQALKALPDNERLQNLAQKLNIYHAADLSIDLPTNYQIREHNYKMSDHGLFVASIVNEYAPYADLHLVQVLNDYGIGTIKTILGGLLNLYNYKTTKLKPAFEYNPLGVERRNLPRRLVINLSLMLNLPRPACKGKNDEPVLEHPRPDLTWGNLTDVGFAERMGWPLEVVLEWVINEFVTHGATIVAAAGNDGSETQSGKIVRRIARYPAAYKNVVGIGAKGKTDDPTEYTNLSDEPTKDGFLVFGGEPDANPAKSIYTDPVKGVLGVYIGDFPRLGDINQYGLAMWAGTSFACPMYAGKFANSLGRGLSPVEVDKVAKDHSDVNPFGERIIR